MSDADTRALIGRFFEAFNAGDREGMLACLAEDVAHDVNQGGREIGRERFRWFLAERARHFREEVSDIVVMTGQGGSRAAAQFTLRGTYSTTAEGLPPASGQHYALTAGCFFEIDDQLISRIGGVLNLAEFVRQVTGG